MTGFRPPREMRTPAQRAADRLAADRQAGRAAGRGVDEDLIAQRADAVIADREAYVRANPRSTLERLERVLGGPPGSLAVRGERLVRADRLTEAEVELLTGRAVPVPHLEGRLLVLHDSRAQPVPTSLHYAVPFGPVMKAAVGPEPASQVRAEAATSPAPGAVKVAVIDTGIAESARGDGWLAGVRRAADYRDRLDVLPPPGRLDLGAGHGTFVAGVIEQVAGSAAETTMYRALDTDGVGTEAAVASAMVLAARQGHKILNLSLGLQTIGDAAPVGLEVAVEMIRESWPDVLIVAAAGNFGDSRPCWPAALPGVTTVAGLDCAMQRAPWSSGGPWVECSTIGEAVRSTFVTGTERDDVDPDPIADVYQRDAWAIWSGTSFAAPQVVGAVAQLAVSNGMSPIDALALLLHDADDDADVGRKVKILEPNR